MTRQFSVVILLLVFIGVSVSKGKKPNEVRLTGEVATVRTFKAGAATSNITPPLDEPIISGWNSPPANRR